MEDWKIGRLLDGKMEDWKIGGPFFLPSALPFPPSTPPVFDGCDGFHNRDGSSTVAESVDCIR